MPLTRRGVTFSDAYLEAANIGRNGYAMLDALELYHPLAPERIRFVNDYASLFATLEDDAPEDAGVEVEFLPCPCSLVPDEESDNASSPDYLVKVDNLTGRISSLLDLTRGSVIPWICTNRKYDSSNTSAPAQLPVTVRELLTVTIDGPTVYLSFGFGDPGNFGFPGLTFNRVEYPTLER